MKRITQKAMAVMLAAIMICMIIPTYSENASWDCPKCGETGNTDNYCGRCKQPAPWLEAGNEEATYETADKDLEAQIAELTRKLVEMETAAKTAAEEAAKAKAEAVAAATQAATIVLRTELESQLSAAKEEKAEAETQVNALTSQLAIAESRIAELTKQLEEAIAANNTDGSTKRHLTVGDLITFGQYEQDNNIMNGKEEIEWIVLDYNEKENKALLLSKYGLEAQPYNSSFSSITWETCALRGWLNKEFYNTAFTQAEQRSILTTAVDNSQSQGYSGWNTNGGNNTQDKIFLLSYTEANQYLGVAYGYRDNSVSRAAATEYAKERGAYANNSFKTTDGDAAGWWWLRSPGSDPGDAANVSCGGSLSSNYVHGGRAIVRPAIWINLESDLF